MTRSEFIVEHNKARIANKDKWIFGHYYVGDTLISIKSFNTWTQVIKVGDSIRDGGNMGLNTAEWKQELGNFLTK